ncbi:ArnT family glycosyltransferase [Nocardia altamirensis]|uniref:ArnT family glycosyltransferase n=1 Tax=Nocardia altamirensis TaxID=472158 RepID=UPI00084040D5|nr:glycosyltransferase family 39 protein [Nocardia altamirensis]
MTLTTDRPESAASPTTRRSARALFLGPPTQPRWTRPSFAALLIATAMLYLWGLGSSGWGNEFYAAAAWAGTEDWAALLFGSVDPGNIITVDKPPAAIWVMALSGRLLGFSMFSVLLPQALMGVGAVALLAATVRRWHGPAAGLLAGAVLALTPVAALMFRYDNPDALLVLLLVAAAYCVVRATETASTRWIALAGVVLGFAFLTKLLQAFLVLPAFGLVFLIAAPVGIWSRIRKLAIACAAMIISGGWFVLLVELWPASSRPYIGGSTNNSLWELTLGYNGVGRLLGGSGNSRGAGSGDFPHFGGTPGITRLLTQSAGAEISWLLPVALLGLLAGLWTFRRAPRTDRTRAGLVLWGGWLLLTALVFSFMSGTFHEYYTVALAPAMAALAAIGVREIWCRRENFAARSMLALMAASVGLWNFVLLDRTQDWLPWLRWVLLIGSFTVAAAFLVAGHFRTFTVVLAATGLLFGLGGTTAYTLETISVRHSGGIINSGPPQDSAFGHGDDIAANAALNVLLQNTDTRWAAATISSRVGTQLELSSGKSVICLGGFLGGDPAPTLAQFQSYVTSGAVRYFVATGRGNAEEPESSTDALPWGVPADSVTAAITAWVKANFTATTVGSTTVYDLTH